MLDLHFIIMKILALACLGLTLVTPRVLIPTGVKSLIRKITRRISISIEELSRFSTIRDFYRTKQFFLLSYELSAGTN